MESATSRKLLWIAIVGLALTAPGCGKEKSTEEQEVARVVSSRADAARLRNMSMPSHPRMVAILDRIAALCDDENRFIGDLENRQMRAAIQSLPGQAPIQQRLQIMTNLAHAETKIGNVDEAIRIMNAALGLATGLPVDSRARTEIEMRFSLGVMWLRKGEIENCVSCCNGESCLYPLSKVAVHTKKQGSTNAAAEFLTVVRATNPQSIGHYASRWLLNLCHMTLGTFPDGVPREYLLDSKQFTGTVEFPEFKNVARDIGLDVFALAGGCVVDDFTNDGIFDVVMSTMDPRASLRFFRGTPDGHFVDETELSGLDEIVGGGLHLIQCDYDGDGWLDLFVPRGAWLQEKGRHPNSLLRNEGDGTFVDVTYDAGLAAIDYPSQVAVWADYDNDADMDLFVGNEANADHPYPSQLFQNRGDGTFVDVAEKAGLTNLAYAKGAAWGDIDEDRYPDLYVSNMGKENRLYHNNGDGTFTDIAPKLGMTGPIESFPCWFWDYDNDGALDLFVASYQQDLGSFVASRAANIGSGAPALYRGSGTGRFQNVASATGLIHPVMAMGANFGDLDNDGFLDMYIGTGFPGYEGVVPNLLYWNRQGIGFTDVSGPSRTGSLQKGHGVAFADLNGDGHDDIVARLGGAYRADGFSTSVYRNPGNGNAWIEVTLRGTRSNRQGVGARIDVTVTESGRQRQIHRWVGQNSSFGGNPYRQHIGLGSASTIDELSVYWPTTHMSQTFRDLPARQRIEIVEGESDPTPLTR